MMLNVDQLRSINRQVEELQQRLQEPETWEKPELFGKLQRELQELAPLAEEITNWEKNEAALAEAELMLQDVELRELAEEEKQTLLQNRYRVIVLSETFEKEDGYYRVILEAACIGANYG